MKKCNPLEIIHSKKGIVIIIAAVGVILTVSLILAMGSSQDEVSYRETTVQYGDLVVGVTKSGSVDIGTVEQVFELDMSALQRADTGSSSGSGTGGTDGYGSSQSTGVSGLKAGEGTGFSGFQAGGSMSGGSGGTGGLDMFSQIFSMGGNSSNQNTSSIGSLKVKEVCVSAGQQVKEGDVLYRLEEDTVNELKEQLQSNVEKAKADLDAVYAGQVLSRQTARYNYDSSLAYGGYASLEYNTYINELEETVTEKEEALELARNNLDIYEKQLEQVNQDYEAAAKVLANCEWSRDNTDKYDNTYYYVTYFQMAQTAENNAESLEQKKEQLEKTVEQAKQNVASCTQELNDARRNLETGKLTATQTLALRQLAYENARETYDIALAYLEDDASQQEETYAKAQQKWEEFSSHIVDSAVCARYNGVITSVDMEEGDVIQTNDTLVTLYDMDEVTMAVNVDEDDMADIQVGTQANVVFTAYPDQIFQAVVSAVGDAQTDSNGNVIYEVTITLKGDVSGLFQGMTGNITFITKETKEVLYVSNRAIIREGTVSYVKVKEEDGSIRKQEVVTGFSDGVNVEIVEGLSEGDVVLIESKVNES